MEVQITVLTRRGNALMRQSKRISSRRVRFGRGTGSEVPLSDIRVDLTAAAMFQLGGGVMIEGLGPSPLRINGATSKAASVKPGDQVLIGPYQIKFDEPSPGLDAALTIELVQPLGDSLDRLMSHSRIGLERSGLGKRRTAWLGFLLILLISLIVPVAVYSTGSIQSLRDATVELNPVRLIALLWEPGELSNSHRFFAANCSTCHQSAFTSVADKACLSCHEGVGAHIERGLQIGGMQHVLEASRCTDCHVEHRGMRGIVVSDMRLCLGCHRSLSETTPAAGVADVGGFPGGHPQFRATLVAKSAGPELTRAKVDANPPPVNQPGIKFSHAAHLVPNGFPALGIKPLGCDTCHVAEPSGQGFQPVTYKQQCASCHALDFERQELPWPNARVPHGDDVGIAAAVWNFYAGKAVQGGMVEPPAAGITRRVPGAPLLTSSDSPPDNTQQWVAAKTETALRTIVLDDKRGCAYCHFGTGPNGALDVSRLVRSGAGPPGPSPERLVAPVVLRTRFLPHARFDHAKHAAVDCAQCHAAATAETVGQLLIPGIENCAQCHGAENAKLHAQSTCTTCHGFHSAGYGPMREVDAARNQ